MPVVGLANITMNDRSAESSSMQAHTVVLTDVNFVAQGLLRTAWVVAIQAMSLGVQIKEQASICDISAGSGTSSATGQREIKLAVAYHDNVTFGNYVSELPVYNDTYNLPASDNVDQATPEWAALKLAMENYQLSPNGNAITVDGGRLVGRNI